MVNVFVALLIVAIVGALGGLGHGAWFSDLSLPLRSDKEEHSVSMAGTQVKLAMHPNSLLKEAGLGAASALIFYGSTIAPAVALGFHIQVEMLLGSISGIALVGLSGTDYLRRVIKQRQWDRLDPAYDEKDDQFKKSIKRGITSPIVALRAMAIK